MKSMRPAFVQSGFRARLPSGMTSDALFLTPMKMPPMLMRLSMLRCCCSKSVNQRMQVLVANDRYAKQSLDKELVLRRGKIDGVIRTSWCVPCFGGDAQNEARCGKAR